MASTKLPYQILILILFLFPISGQAQVEDDVILNFSKSTGKLKQKANSAIEAEDHLLAQLYLKELVKRKPNNTKYQFELGKALFINREYELALEHLSNAIENHDGAYLYYVASKIRLGKYDEAETDYKTLRKKVSYNELSKPQKQIYTGIREDIEFYNGKKEIPLCFTDKEAKVTRLSENVNGKMTEFSPIMLDDNTLFHGSTRPDNLPFYQKETDEIDVPRRTYYLADKQGDTWTNIRAFSFTDIDNDEIDFGGACFNLDQDEMYLTLCERKEFEFECHLYKSKKGNSGWSKPKKITGRINADGYNSIQPFITFDTLLNVEVLYFSSNKKGSRGYDLWYAVWNDEYQQFKEVTKCGRDVNTTANEYAPFYIDDERILYFSSDGHGGYGGLDIMRIHGIAADWENLEKLPEPINSSADDVYFFYDEANDSGYFSSNRSSVNNIAGKACCEDLFSFTFEEKIIVEPLIVDSPIVADEIPLLDVSIPISLTIGKIENVVNTTPTLLEIYRIENGEPQLISEEVMQDLSMNKVLQNKYKYRFVFKKEGYLSSSKDIDLTEHKEETIKQVTAKIDPIPKEAIVIPGINFEFDSDKLTTESLSTLDEYIHRLLIDNGDIKIQINAHTDNKGSDAYNLTLSEKRARSVMNYLITKGINPARLLSKGFGETSPIAANNFPDGSDNEAGRAKNRRIEFEVVE